MRQRAVFVLAVRVDHGQCGRQRIRTEVVIQHDDICALGGGDRLMAEGATVNADNQVVGRGERLHRRDVGAIALVDPVGDIECRVVAHRAQPDQQQCG